MGRFTVLRGSKNIRDLGRVLKFNDETEMDVWFGDECNEYRGTDSTIFPPFTKTGGDIWAYEPQLCRSMPCIYQYPSKYSGIKTSFYSLDFGDIANDPKLQCLCRDPEKCPVKGTLDLFPCTGTTIVATLPHFLKSAHRCISPTESSSVNLKFRFYFSWSIGDRENCVGNESEWDGTWNYIGFSWSKSNTFSDIFNQLFINSCFLYLLVFWHTIVRCKTFATELGCYTIGRCSDHEGFAGDDIADALVGRRCSIEYNLR